MMYSDGLPEASEEIRVTVKAWESAARALADADMARMQATGARVYAEKAETDEARSRVVLADQQAETAHDAMLEAVGWGDAGEAVKARHAANRAKLARKMADQHARAARREWEDRKAADKARALAEINGG